MLNISEGIQPRPQKVVMYGPEGIGKSTLASKFPDPLFIDTEGGTSQMDIKRADPPTDWMELLTIVTEIASEPVCKTMVLDTADWAEQLCIQHILNVSKKTSIESFGYGKGYTYVAEEFGKLIHAMDMVIRSGKNVVVTAHAKMRKFEQPDEIGAYDRWELKLTRQVAPLLKEWSDLLLFLNYKTYVVTSDDGKAKAQGGSRVMYTTHHACWDAKNRHGLAEELPLEYEPLAKIFEEPKKAKKKTRKKAEKKEEPEEKKTVPETPLEAIRLLMEKEEITEEELQKAVAERGHYSADTPIEEYEASFQQKWVLKYWDNLVKMIKEARNG